MMMTRRILFVLVLLGLCNLLVGEAIADTTSTDSGTTASASISDPTGPGCKPACSSTTTT